MSEVLTNTTASAIGRALIAARRAGGSQATGQVLTLVVVTDGEEHTEAVEAAVRSAAEHPARILVARRRPDSGVARLDAEVCGSGERGPGELVVLDLHGELAAHGGSVVLPLLGPDAPVVTFWPGEPPDDPAADPIGALSQRRITDLASAADPRAALARRAATYAEGDTDLSWTRLTRWRSVLAAAFDQPHAAVESGVLAGEPDSPSTELLARWLELRLGVPIERRTSDGPGLTEVRLRTPDGEIAVVRTDGALATLCAPGWPERPIALPRRSLSELMAEELRRLDPDEIFAECLAAVPARQPV
ncbi:glucose-6-phosphate dehydrogenase assembly protein OpcA [Sporichthya brevicatena]|uniref:Glucose-6-phosphate dehydrogenase assembly protein OpcA n=1 Tax=Sporichthya brevicatena TaxID=171442 RepID=A0ABN1GZI4_9ACTN